ncbi:unnamed protein product [Prorocentrum cordatum]|uniref:Uncharacterized protein n=1 Tax=Prorocentrum cordatum TaxID=2364126 RepID=A0ABN9Q1V0_9DINO|nr:unnamed protein product [Polarella glacialis]
MAALAALAEQEEGEEELSSPRAGAATEAPCPEGGDPTGGKRRHRSWGKKMCVRVARDLLERCAQEEAEYHRGLLEAVREAVLALEEWAEDARAAVRRLRGPPGGEVETIPTPASGLSPDDGEETPDGALGPLLDENISNSDLEKAALCAAEDNDRMALRLLPGGGGGGLHEPPSADAGMDDSGVVASLMRLAQENAKLAREWPRAPRGRLRSSSHRFAQQVAGLESLARACVASGSQQRHPYVRWRSSPASSSSGSGSPSRPRDARTGAAVPSPRSAAPRPSHAREAAAAPSPSPPDSPADAAAKGPFGSGPFEESSPGEPVAAPTGNPFEDIPSEESSSEEAAAAETRNPFEGSPFEDSSPEVVAAAATRISVEGSPFEESSPEEAAAAATRVSLEDSPFVESSPGEKSPTFGQSRNFSGLTPPSGVGRLGSQVLPDADSWGQITGQQASPRPDRGPFGTLGAETPPRSAVEHGAADDPQRQHREDDSPRELPATFSSSSFKAELADSFEAALGHSDATLHGDRLGDEAGYWNWGRWRDYHAEERHRELLAVSWRLTEALSDEDWAMLAYELMLLVQSALTEDDPAFQRVRDALPIFRTALGISSKQHHHLCELTVPDGSQAYDPLDVRFRAAILLRSWAHAEVPAWGLDPFKCGISQWTRAWILRQIEVILRSVLARSAEDGEAPTVGACEASGGATVSQVARECEERLRALSGLAAEVDGRQALAELMDCLDSVCPPGDRWHFHTLTAAKVFSVLWKAATDPGEDHQVSGNAKLVAEALLMGLQPRLASPPLEMETHALLLAQQVWIGLSGVTPMSRMRFLPEGAVKAAAAMLGDFSSWLQRASVDTALCLVARGVHSRDQHSADFEAAEIMARRLLSVELRDSVLQQLRDIRTHLTPAASVSAIAVWHRSAQLNQLPRSEAGASREFIRRMGQWLVFESNSALAERELEAYDEPPQVGTADEWRKAGPAIQKHLEGLAAAVETLTRDFEECERRCYHEAWEAVGLGEDHLGIAVAALCDAVRPRVLPLVEHGVWPSEGSEVMEIPAGGGKLLHALESLDRAARKFPLPRRRAAGGALADLLVPHVAAALKVRFSAISRDATSRALAEIELRPLRAPTLLHCEGVVTLWRFVPRCVDQGGCSAFYSPDVVEQAQQRLTWPPQGTRAFPIAQRAAAVIAEITSGAHESADSDEEVADEDPISPQRAVRTRSTSRRTRIFRMGSRRTAVDEAGATANVISEPQYLEEVDEEACREPVQVVSVRLSSLAFCLTELDRATSRLRAEVNRNDSSDEPTVRYNHARCMLAGELNDVREALLEHGRALARHLASRLVLRELRQDLFERLYFAPPGADESAAVLTMEALVDQRKQSFLNLMGQTPSPMLVQFVVQLGLQLSGAWIYVVVDYLARKRASKVRQHFEEDMSAVKHLLDALMEEALRRARGGPQADGSPSGALEASPGPRLWGSLRTKMRTGELQALLTDGGEGTPERRALQQELTVEECNQGRRAWQETEKALQLLSARLELVSSDDQLATYAGHVLWGSPPTPTGERARSPAPALAADAHRQSSWKTPLSAPKGRGTLTAGPARDAAASAAFRGTSSERLGRAALRSSSPPAGTAAAAEHEPHRSSKQTKKVLGSKSLGKIAASATSRGASTERRGRSPSDMRSPSPPRAAPAGVEGEAEGPSKQSKKAHGIKSLGKMFKRSGKS